MWLKSSDSETIKNVEGEIVKLEKEEYGFWIVDCSLKIVFEKLLPHFNVNKELVIILKQ